MDLKIEGKILKSIGRKTIEVRWDEKRVIRVGKRKK